MNSFHKCRTLIAALLFASMFSPLTAVAQRERVAAGNGKYDACKLLNGGDASVLLGQGATSTLTQGGQNCTWTSPASKKKLMVRTPESTRTKPGVTFDTFRNGPRRNSVVADEPQWGDHAFSVITPNGVEFMVLKNDRILYIQYFEAYGVKPSPEMLTLARPIIAKAVTAF